ncbi:MAG: trimethylamine methyltransferase family protein, partial [Dethiobacteria bacterium]
MNVVKGLGLQFLSTHDLEAIHEATLRVLAESGLKVFGDEALDIYAAAGCDVDKENNIVKIPRRVVEDAIEAAPS